MDSYTLPRSVLWANSTLTAIQKSIQVRQQGSNMCRYYQEISCSQLQYFTPALSVINDAESFSAVEPLCFSGNKDVMCSNGIIGMLAILFMLPLITSTITHFYSQSIYSAKSRWGTCMQGCLWRRWEWEAGQLANLPNDILSILFIHPRASHDSILPAAWLLIRPHKHPTNDRLATRTTYQQLVIMTFIIIQYSIASRCCPLARQERNTV